MATQTGDERSGKCGYQADLGGAAGSVPTRAGKRVVLFSGAGSCLQAVKNATSVQRSEVRRNKVRRACVGGKAGSVIPRLKG